ncbi:MAG: helicase-related protein [Rhodoblastus sp.]
MLDEAGIASGAIHGNKSQGHRQRTLGDFKAGRTRVLVATDIAARGIDVDGVTHVVNFELPEVPETYVHRIGRTARAGAEGVAISLCDNGERHLLRAIEKTTRQQIPTEDRRDPSARHDQAEEGSPERKRGPARPRRQQSRPQQRPHGEARAAHRPAAPRAEPNAQKSNGHKPNAAKPVQKPSGVKPQGAKNRWRRGRGAGGAPA